MAGEEEEGNGLKRYLWKRGFSFPGRRFGLRLGHGPVRGMYLTRK